MKIYINDNGISLVGKSWEIRNKLKEYGRDYATVSDWIHNERKNNQKHKIIPFPHKKHK